jgi:ribosomal protein S18 acetylase RimI-like enzyme
LSFDLVEVAEDAWGLMPSLVSTRREAYDDVILIDEIGPAAYRMALRNRFEERTLEERLRAVRRWFAEQGRTDFTWIVGTRSSPASLVDRLLADGARPVEDDPEMTAMVLTEEPPAVDGIEIRVSETFADALVGRDLTAAVHGIPAEQVPSDDEQRRIWLAGRGSDWRTFLAYVDGVPVGRASCAGTEAGPIELLNAAVLPGYRGRGIYRALTRARWDEAVRRGTPVLVTQAGSMSRPILERLGFRAVGAISRFVDRAG